MTIPWSAKTRDVRISQYGTEVSSAAISFLFYFATFIRDTTINDSNYVIISHTVVTATAETSFEHCVGIHPIKTHLEGGN